jgi:TolB-like protein/DNA-binding winged helix-turn-helix (wHTH) protein/Tfp pilus assembly protein PilF
MAAENPTSGKATFGPYVVDLRSGELRKHGTKLKLGEQPFQILILLLQREGELVTRDELQARLWASHTFVDFERSLNSAVQRLRDRLSDTAEKARWIETVPRRGYRFAGQVEWSDESGSSPVLSKLPGGHHGSPVDGTSPTPGMELSPAVCGYTTTAEMESAGDPAKFPRARLLTLRREALISLTAACLLAFLAYSGWHGSPTRARTSPETAVLAVLPFDNLSRDPDQDFFSDGLTEEMIAQLGKLNPGRLAVIARGSVTKYKGSSLPLNQIGRELQADYLVQGSVRRAPGRIRITVQLIQAHDQTDLWTESYDRELKDVLALQGSVARMIANQIRVTLTAEEQKRLANPRTVDPWAYEAYLKGRYYWNKRTGDGLRKGSVYFQQAIDKDPTYSAAYSGLADCYSGLTWHGFRSPADALPKAQAAARKAIEIDPQSAEAHASLGLVLYHRWDWPRAEAEFKRALQLDPQYANAHHWYGDYLSVRGRHDEALIEARQALELDPLNLMIGSWVGLRYYLARKYDRAIEQSQNTVALDPNFAAAHLLLGESYVQMGLHNESIAELQKAAMLSGNSPLYLAQVAVAHAAAGRKTEALRIVPQLQEIAGRSYVSPYAVAQVYAALNDKEQTFKWLQRAYDDRAVWMTYLAVDPVFDSFRSDQRFQDLLRRVGLPQSGSAAGS